MEKLFIAAIAYFAGWFISGRTIGSIMVKNRLIEQNPNRQEEPPTDRELKWHVVHIRDDLGSLCGLLCITNGILAAILAILILRGL
jgi:hypothetical protein